MTNFSRSNTSLSKVAPGVETQQIETAMGGMAPSAIEQLDVPSFSLKSGSDTSSSSERIVIQNSNLSLLVSDVKDAGQKVIDYAVGAGGYMVSAAYNRPSESPFGTITVRVPSERLDDALNNFRKLSIKVTSENLVGQDVTKEFTDFESRLATLNKTKVKLEGILEKATTVTEILQLQREIISIDQQTEKVIGQKRALEENAKLAKVTVYLSTDELALPYAPDKAFRPNVVFKQAVRSLLGSLRVLGETSIWVGVYAVIWIPSVILFIVVKKWLKKRVVRGSVSSDTSSANRS